MTTTRVAPGPTRPDISRNRPRRGAAAALALLLATGPVAVPVLATVMPVLVTAPAEARPGGGMSMGSRGSRTYMAPPSTATNPGGAVPFSRSLTPQSGYGQPGYGQGGYGGMQGRSHPLAAGLMGGLLGFGLGGLLLGHGFFGGGYGGGFGGGSLLGLLIQIAIIAFIVRWLFRRFAGNRMAGASAGNGGGYGGPPPMGGASGGPAMRPGAGLAITPTDYQQFEKALLDIQQAWSMQDLRSLSRFATPEMVSYFSDQLSDLTSRNLRNVVSAVHMENGDLSEAWSEGGREFATVAMRYSLIDVTTDLTGRVVDGSPNERQIVTELWTFVRARGGSWLLSAIQQAR